MVLSTDSPIRSARTLSITGRVDRAGARRTDLCVAGGSQITRQESDPPLTAHASTTRSPRIRRYTGGQRADKSQGRHRSADPDCMLARHVLYLRGNSRNRAGGFRCRLQASRQDDAGDNHPDREENHGHIGDGCQEHCGSDEAIDAHPAWRVL